MILCLRFDPGVLHDYKAALYSVAIQLNVGLTCGIITVDGHRLGDWQTNVERTDRNEASK